MASAAAPDLTGGSGAAVATGDGSSSAEVDVGLGFNFHRDNTMVICDNWLVIVLTDFLYFLNTRPLLFSSSRIPY